MKKYLQILNLLVFAIVLHSCKKNPAETKVESQNKSAFREYVTSYPKKIISVFPDLKFDLNKPAEITDFDGDLVSIYPDAKIKVELVDDVIHITADEKLKADQEYTLTLHLSKLYKEIDEELQDFTTKVQTKPLQYSVTLKTPQLHDKDWNYVEGYIKASDLFEAENLSDLVKASYGGKNIAIKYDIADKLVKRVSFTIDSLKREKDDVELDVVWNGNAIDSDNSGERKIIITGKNNFKVLGVNVFNNGDKRVEIAFSDELKKDQNIKGLIQFNNHHKRAFTYKVNGNVVTLYPTNFRSENLEIQIFKDIKNSNDYSLKEDYLRTVHFEQIKPKVSFVKSGTILPDSDNLKINFNAVNLRAVDLVVSKIYKNNVLQFLQQNDLENLGSMYYVGLPEAKYTIDLSNKGVELSESNAFAVDLADVIDVEPGAMYRVSLDFEKEYSYYTCQGTRPDSEITFGKKELKNLSQGYGYRNYNWNDRENPCTDSYYYDRTISTNILATNLGVIVKKGNNNNTFVAVTDILSTQPVGGATVDFYNLQQQKIGTVTTDAQGTANYIDEKNAFFAVVSKGNDVCYLRLTDGNSLSMSKFDVSGVKLQKGIKGYIYGERGVWRPGDNLFLTFVLNDNANPLPDNHPIKFELYNPQGKLIDQKVQQKTPSNVYAYSPQTSQDAITGKWTLKVSVGGAKFSKGLNIEAIKPNRLKIKMTADEGVLKSGNPITGDVEVKWLHGAIARNMKLDINGRYSQTKTTFDKFKNYHFDDITRQFNSENFTVLKGRLDDEGKTDFSLNPRFESKAPGMIKASFITKVYENGGDFSTDVFSKKISPYSSYVGIDNAQERDSRNYLFTDKDYTFDVASVNEDGVGIVNDLEVIVYKMSWRWWWNTSSNGLSYYDGSKHREPYKEFKVRTGANGKGTFKLKVDKNDWGRYLVKVIDRKSKHATSSVIYYDWPYWYGRKKGNGDQSNASMLVFTADKEAYKVNENATVKFPSSSGGRALITIESGVEVLDYYWVETSDKETKFDFPITDRYAPNVFVNISLLQQHSQTKNDLPIRMYGSIPISVNDPATKLEPQILMADEFEPESVAKIRVEEKSGKTMTYTLALVDEGLLDLTRFKTPNPWNTFYAKQSLGVKTWDVFDDVIGAYGGEINQILSIGGDQENAGSKNKKANRFKPMVEFIGPFELKSGETKFHEIKIPQYIGSVKVMVVASDAQNEAYGSADKTAFVRKPVMVLASLPRKITPQETVTLPVTVFAMKPEIKNVKVTVEENDSYEIVGNATQNLSFSNPDEKMAYFTLKVKDFKGIGKVKVVATSGSEKATYDVEIDVLNPNPVTTEIQEMVLKANESGNIDFTTFGTEGTNEATIELSTLPPMNFTSRLEYLIRYPHGCVEQTTSGAFPQLFLPDIFELPETKVASIQRNIKGAIDRLSKFQTSSGGLSYWPGDGEANDWGSSYAGHFLLEAEKQGYNLPLGFKENWINYQKNQTRNWRANKGSSGKVYNSLNQAYRLFTLCLANNADLASMNRLRETKGITNDAKRRLAGAYALIGKSSISKAILNTVDNDYSIYNHYYSYGSNTRNKAMALETYVLLKDATEEIKLAQEIAKELTSKTWMSTQTTAYALLAIAKYAMQNGDGNKVNASYTVNGSSQNVNSNKALFTSDIENLKKENALKIQNSSNGVLYVRVFTKGILPVGEEKVIERNLETTVNYRSKDGQTISPETLTQGTNFEAIIYVRNLTNKRVNDIALTQYIPSGWEIVNTRYTDFGGNDTASEVDYTDIRDASISNYFSLNGNSSKKFKVLLNASYLGDYYLPGIQCEAMYDNEYLVRSKGRWIKVVK